MPVPSPPPTPGEGRKTNHIRSPGLVFLVFFPLSRGGRAGGDGRGGQGVRARVGGGGPWGGGGGLPPPPPPPPATPAAAPPPPARAHRSPERSIRGAAGGL